MSPGSSRVEGPRQKAFGSSRAIRLSTLNSQLSTMDCRLSTADCRLVLQCPPTPLQPAVSEGNPRRASTGKAADGMRRSRNRAGLCAGIAPSVSRAFRIPCGRRAARRSTPRAARRRRTWTWWKPAAQSIAPKGPSRPKRSKASFNFRPLALGSYFLTPDE